MFTGIVTHLGTIVAVEARGDLRVIIAGDAELATLAIGASIACSGVCLTVVERMADSDGARFAVDLSAETLARTPTERWRTGQRLNLERSLRLGDELGGHIVTGHVDGIGRVISAEDSGGSRRIRLAVPDALAPFVAAKGSLTVDGVSLTVNAVTDVAASSEVAVNIIPHTLSVTTLHELTAGALVNLEIDILARYLSRLEQVRTSRAAQPAA